VRYILACAIDARGVDGVDLVRRDQHRQIGGCEAMANAMPDAGQEVDSYRRVEVITGERRRLRWTGEERARGGELEEGASICEVARRNGVSRGLLTMATSGCGGGGRQGAKLRADSNWRRKSMARQL